jgi:hypothetical protein
MLLELDAGSFFSTCIDWGRSLRTVRFEAVK